MPSVPKQTKKGSRLYTSETPNTVRNLGSNSARSSGVNHTTQAQAAASSTVNKPMTAQRTSIGPGIMWWIAQPAVSTAAETAAKPDQKRRAKALYDSPMIWHVALITKW